MTDINDDLVELLRDSLLMGFYKGLEDLPPKTTINRIDLLVAIDQVKMYLWDKIDQVHTPPVKKGELH